MVGMKIDKWDLLDFAVSTARAAQSFGENGIRSIDFHAEVDITISPELFDQMEFDGVKEEKGKTSALIIRHAKWGGIRFTCYKFPEEPEDGDE